MKKNLWADLFPFLLDGFPENAFVGILIRRHQGASHPRAFDDIDHVMTVASARCTNESLFLLQESWDAVDDDGLLES